MCKKILYLILFLSICSLTACSGTGIIKVGNPDISEPTPVEKVKERLDKEPYWIGDCSSGGECSDQLYIVKYEVENSIIEVLSEDDSINEEVSFSISDDGVVTAGTDNYVITAQLVGDLLKVEFTLFQCEYTFTLIPTDTPKFASNASDLIFGRLLCEKSETKCYDLDAEQGEDQYLIKSSLIAGKLDSEYCGLMYEDKCSEDGKILYEVVCTDIVNQANSGYAIQEVYCDCVDGACVDLVEKEKMSAPVNQNLKPFLFTPQLLDKIDEVVLDSDVLNIDN